MSTKSASSAGLDQREADALTSYMTVLEAHHGDSEQFSVTSESGREYAVDLRAESCTCHDCLHRGGPCKHIHRVRFATGRRVIPAWVILENVDEQLGMHVSGAPLVETGAGGTEVFGE